MSKSTQGVKKGLPRRCSNAHLKEARARRWKAGEERKRLRREAGEAAHRRNVKLRSEGKPTPWEVANGWVPGEAVRRRQVRRERHAEVRRRAAEARRAAVGSSRGGR